MKFFLSIFLLSAVFVFGGTAFADLNWETDLETARKQAQAQERPLVVYAWMSSAKTCEQFERDVLAQPRAQEILSRATLCKVDARSDLEFRREHQLFRVPTILVFQSDGKLITKQIRVDTVQNFVADLAPLLPQQSLPNAAANGKRSIVGVWRYIALDNVYYRIFNADGTAYVRTPDNRKMGWWDSFRWEQNGDTVRIINDAGEDVETIQMIDSNRVEFVDFPNYSPGWRIADEALIKAGEKAIASWNYRAVGADYARVFLPTGKALLYIDGEDSKLWGKYYWHMSKPDTICVEYNSGDEWKRFHHQFVDYNTLKFIEDSWPNATRGPIPQELRN